MTGDFVVTVRTLSFTEDNFVGALKIYREHFVTKGNVSYDCDVFLQLEDH